MNDGDIIRRNLGLDREIDEALERIGKRLELLVADRNELLDAVLRAASWLDDEDAERNIGKDGREVLKLLKTAAERAGSKQ